jgi:tRNA(Ile2) C34 agmatinyltransferase TiaS
VIDSWQGTFMSRDSRKGRSLIAPRGNCPVLFGVRARDEKTANNAAKKLLQAEATQSSIGMRTFLTNQASDDHLSQLYSGKVISTKILSRGHVIIKVNSNEIKSSDEEEAVEEGTTWMAFAQSRDVKNLAQWFQAGDLIKGKGLVSEDGSLHLEKLKLIEASERNKRRPPCERCGKTVKSQGKNNKLRCPACKNLQENIWIYNPQNPPHRGWVQPPTDHRRHLSRPLKWDQE